MMGSTLRTLRNRLVPAQRRKDIRVAAYCCAYGTDDAEATEGSN